MPIQERMYYFNINKNVISFNYLFYI